ncbi:inhibitory synaptic factor 1 [Erpetoichthys calabaricus]|uniref:Inhibitory synaptic factor 1 n=1 Tax=Erpetoichthys calabaricus TaxID=27687 RepID=A0A8C4SLT3_ERPCA|nr:inhibitory synaptic factor 1 [Erpetoichthys calabaricus]
MSLSSAQAQDCSEIPSQREQIRSRMKMVIEQLEGILVELKEVARELREVVGQIDKLTSDFDFDLEPDDWTVATASSTSSSERGLGDTFSRLDFLTPDILSDSWEFCSFLETPAVMAATPEQPTYEQMNGRVVPNGPVAVTPDSSSEEAVGSTHTHKSSSRTSGTRERVRFSDKVLYHALCCDDDEEGAADEGGRSPEVDSDQSQNAPSANPLNCPGALSPVLTAAKRGPSTGPRKKVLRNSSTQTVSDKSTQTLLPYVPAKPKAKEPN